MCSTKSEGMIVASLQQCSCTHSVEDKTHTWVALTSYRCGVTFIYAYKTSEFPVATKLQQLGHSMKTWVIKTVHSFYNVYSTYAVYCICRLTWNKNQAPWFNLASFPDFTGTYTSVHGESLISFLMWLWCNQNRTRVFRTERERFAHCSTNHAFNAQCVWYSLPDNQRCVVSYLLPCLFLLFWVFEYAHT